jgi:hypothetical protein
MKRKCAATKSAKGNCLNETACADFWSSPHEWKEVETARLFLDALADRAAGDLDGGIDDRTASEWIAWARESLRTHGPLEAGVTTVFRAIASIDQWTYRDE